MRIGDGDNLDAGGGGSDKEEPRGIKPRNSNRIRHNQSTASAAHRDSLLDSWFKAVPGKYQGHHPSEIKQGNWNGRLDRNGVLDLQGYLERPSKFLLLYGDKGTGKSTLATTLVSHLISTQRVGARYRVAPRLLTDFSFRPDGRDPLREAIEAPILLLDDLGAANEGMSSIQERSMWSLIDGRWSNPNCFTLLTTNMSIGGTGKGVGLIEWLTTTAWDRVQDDLVDAQLKGRSQRG